MIEFLFNLGDEALLVLGVAVGTAAALHALMSKNEVRAAIAWIGVIALAPFAGSLIYLVAGVNEIRRARMLRRRAIMARAVKNARPPFSAKSAPQIFRSLAQLGNHIADRPLTSGNEIAILGGGEETYGAMLEAIHAAKQTIALQTYIFEDDAAGRPIADGLIAAQKRGVAVRVLIDGIGANYSQPPVSRRLRANGIATRLFMPTFFGLRLPYANMRSHRKLLIVDGETGFTGGMNIRHHFLASAMGKHVAFDTHFRVKGPVVEQLSVAFAEDWLFASGEELRGRGWFSDQSEHGSAHARVITSHPSQFGNNHAMILGALAAAEKRVRICTPYFIPEQTLIAGLAIAAKRGIQVDIVIPLASNLRLVDCAARAQFAQVIEPGCRIWRVSKKFDHSKLLVVDGVWALVGSSNIDPRSLRLNFELDMEIYDAATAGKIERAIEEKMAEAVLETLERLRKYPWLARLRDRIVWLASPYL